MFESVGDRDRVVDRNLKSSDRDLKKKIAILKKDRDRKFLDCNPKRIAIEGRVDNRIEKISNTNV